MINRLTNNHKILRRWLFNSIYFVPIFDKTPIDMDALPFSIIERLSSYDI